MAKTIEQRLEFLYNTREEMRVLDKQKSDLQAAYDQEEYYLIQEMQEAGLASAGISRCTASLKQEKYPKVEDMDQFVRWCADNDKAMMIQKRVSKAVFDEFFQQNGEYPDGVDTYDKLTLGIRKR